MRFGDVNHQESDAIAVPLVKLIERGSLPPEWRSGIAAKHQHYRLGLIQFRKFDSFAFVQLKQREVRRGISDVQFAGPSLHPGSFEREEQEGDWAWHSGHDPPEGFWRLAHGPQNESSETDIGNHYPGKNPE
jgi:hypothetical protein